MFRLISALLLLAGLAIAVYGGLRLNGTQLLASGPPEEPIVVAVMEEDAPLEVENAAKSAQLPPAPSAAAKRSAGLPETDGVIALEEVADDLAAVIEGPAGAPEPSFDIMSAPGAVAPVPARSVEEVAESLREVPVAYETPEAVPLGKTFDVTFAIDATGDDSATEGLPGGQDASVVEGTARVSDRVKAQLTGSAFEIVLSSPDVQRLSLDTENVWRWRVRALEAGDHALIMELFVLEGTEPRPVRTFNDRVVVSVSALQKAVGVANTANPIVMVLGGIGSALGGLFGVFRFFRPGK